jgi:hypothetical protein
MKLRTWLPATKVRRYLCVQRVGSKFPFSDSCRRYLVLGHSGIDRVRRTALPWGGLAVLMHQLPERMFVFVDDEDEDEDNIAPKTCVFSHQTVDWPRRQKWPVRLLKARFNPSTETFVVTIGLSTLWESVGQTRVFTFCAEGGS